MENGDRTPIAEGNPSQRALVLPGGGGRGAYQVGVVKALFEKGLKFDMAFGTSIGGINAAVVAQGGIERLEELWCQIRAQDIFQTALTRTRWVACSSVISSACWTILPGRTASPRGSTLPKLRPSNMQIGWVATDLCSLETKLFMMDDIMSTNELIDVMMATSAIPMAFPPRHINGHGLWVDGGLVRNTPMETAIQMGARRGLHGAFAPEKNQRLPDQYVRSNCALFGYCS